MRSRARRWLVLASAAAGAALALSPARLIARWNADHLQVTPIDLHFLTGTALQRLHNGRAVPFAFRLSLSGAQPAPLQNAFARFIVSYDVWAEKFKVVNVSGTRRAVTNLAADAAEEWCLSQMTVPATGLSADAELWMRLDIRAEDTLPRSPVTDSGIALKSLIDLFTVPPESRTQQWTAETAHFRLSSLRQ